ncbi:MAG: hypothetical protein BRD55_04520 [Bacteroidetes bacterium SW_9_63_38]|nr:MAG: hypothetical protein BRD55_04520 [Bacteroidetes bacterium SW_9_63_38]
MPRGYLAVSGLNSRRPRPAPSYTGAQEGAPITNATCPALAPGATFEVRGTGGGSQTITYEHAYTSFLLYLYEKLQPEEVAVFVESNLFKKHCPSRWAGFADLYHLIYDTVRNEVGSSPRLFTSFTYLVQLQRVRCAIEIPQAGAWSNSKLLSPKDRLKLHWTSSTTMWSAVHGRAPGRIL